MKILCIFAMPWEAHNIKKRMGHAAARFLKEARIVLMVRHQSHRQRRTTLCATIQ